MPKTFWTMFVGLLAISGIPIFAGFFSKDEILYRTFSTTALPGNLGKILWVVGALTALLTAIYMTRMMTLTFAGEERFAKGHDDSHGHSGHGDAHDDHGHHGKPHESPAVMWVPLAVLAVLSTVGGLVGIPAAMGGTNPFEHFLAPAIARVQPAAHGAETAHAVGAGTAAAPAAAVAEEHHDTKTELGLAGFSIVLALTGIAIGYFGFKRQPLRHMPKLLEEKYYVDEVYEASVIEPIEHTSRSFLWKVVDVKLIDGFVNGVAKVFSGLAGVLRYTQTGFARGYAAVILVGAIVVIGYFGYIALK